MWKKTMINNALIYSKLFNNDKLLREIESHNTEYGDPIIYLPIEQYLKRRFIPHIEKIGIDEVKEMFSKRLRGTRVKVDFTAETRVLAFLVGLRETGLSAVVRNRRPAHDENYFLLGGTLYIKNFYGSGLDILDNRRVRTEVSKYLSRPRSVFVDDPNETDESIGIKQTNLHCVFASYFKYQYKFFLIGILSSVNNRLIRYFWRALTFGGPGGSNWEKSIKGGRNSLLTLFRLLNVDPKFVPSLWNSHFISNKINGINNIIILKKIARDINSDKRLNDLDYWRRKAIEEIPIGLGTARYFQAMKLGAIASSFSDFLENPTAVHYRKCIFYN